MTNPVSSDNFSTNSLLNERKADTRSVDQGPGRAPAGTTAPADKAEINGARQRLSEAAQKTGETAITSIEQARQQIAALREQMAADPKGAAAAHGNIDGDIFEAAIARPTG